MTTRQVSEFKKTEIGKIPKNWEVKAMETLFEISAGGDLTKISFSKDKSTEYKFPIYSNSWEKKGLYGFSKEYQFEPECVTITARGNVGRSECRREPFNAIVRLLVLKPKQKLSCDFFANYINNKLDFSHVGSAVNQLTAPMISERVVALPPLHEQEQMGKIFREIESKIENLQNQNKILEEIAQTMFKSWFVNFDGVTEFEDSELGQIPKGWKTGSFSDISEITSGKRPDFISEISTESYKIPLYGASGIMGYVKNALYQKPIILTGRVGTIGIVQNIFEDCFPSDNTLVILPIKDFFHHHIVNFLKIVDFESIKGGSTQPLITQTSLKNLDCIIPEKNILEKFERISKNLQLTSNLKKYQITELSKIRDSLLPKLMSGEIRV